MNQEELESRRSERRRAPRYRYQAAVEIEWGSARLRARTRDVSAGGMFIESEDILWVGAGFRARLTSNGPFWIDCSVKRVEPGYGMGVIVTVSEKQHLQRYQQLLSTLSTPTP